MVPSPARPPRRSWLLTLVLFKIALNNKTQDYKKKNLLRRKPFAFSPKHFFFTYYCNITKYNTTIFSIDMFKYSHWVFFGQLKIVYGGQNSVYKK